MITVKYNPSQVGTNLALARQTHSHTHMHTHSAFISLGKEEASLPVGAAKQQWVLRAARSLGRAHAQPNAEIARLWQGVSPGEQEPKSL